MKTKASFGIIIGILLFLSSLAHAFLGWPNLYVELTSTHVSDKIIGALAIGWYFGSVAMATFGIIVLLAGHKMLKGNPFSSAPIYIISFAYFLFGFVAFIARDFNPHFLFFIVMGILVGLFAKFIQH